MASPPRILMIVQRFPPEIGGLANSGARIAGALARIGASVEVLAWTRALPPGVLESMDAGEADPRARGATLHRLGLFSHWDLSLQHTLNVLDWKHQEAPFDVLWGHYLYPPGFLAVWFAEQAGISSTVSARGNDVDQMIFDGLTPEYFRNPIVTAEIISYRDFYIIGEVANPGHFPYVGGMTVITAVAMAGGFTYRAAEDEFAISRGGQQIRGGKRTAVLPGDVIEVEERFF